MTATRGLDEKLLVAAERLGRALRIGRQQIATRHHLSLLQVTLLQGLSDGRPRRVGELAAELDVTQATISDAVTSLADKGHAVREPDPADGRASLVRLTESGWRIAHQVVNELAPMFGQQTDSPTEDKATALRVILSEIRRLNANGVITIDRSCMTCDHFQPPGDGDPAHCLLLDEVLTDAALRVDCPDHHPKAS